MVHPFRLALAIAMALAMAASALIVPNGVRAVAEGQKVVVIVGPVGSLTSNYRSRGDAVASAAQALGATVVKVYSPNATWANVKAAVNGANIIVYIGHGSGFPNPYSSTLQTYSADGWGLNRIAGIDANDPTGDGDAWNSSLVYCGEAALEGKALPSGSAQKTYCSGGTITPAPNFVMVYSNACYTPGAGETEHIAVSSEATARARVENYSRPILALGGTYFATDLGSRSVVEEILKNPDQGFGQIYTETSGYVPGAVKTFTHSRFAGAQAWLQKSSGPGGSVSYFHAFAGDPSRTPSGATGAPIPDLARPVLTAQSPYAFQTGVSQSATASVTFDKPVVGVDESNFTLHDIDAEWWQTENATVTWNESTLTATLDPDVSLDPDRWYVLTLGDNVEDIWGNPLGETSWAFKTTGGSTPQSEVFSPTRTLNFLAGTYVGRMFDAYGNVQASKSVTLNATSGAPTSQKGPIPYQNGNWYFITAGAWAGYWIQETAATTLGAPPPVWPAPLATYNPAQSLYFSAGTYVGRKFDSYGSAIASKSYTLSATSGAPTIEKRQVPNQAGNWYLITSGVWSGYYVPESAGTSMTPPPAWPAPLATYNPAQTLYISAGTYVGRKFDVYGNVTSSKSYTLSATSGAPTTEKRQVPNQAGNWYLITAGVWSGYYLPESAGTTLVAPPAWPAPLATYSPAQTLYFAAGTYVGRKFDSYGNVTSSKSYTLGAPSGAPTTEKRQVPNQAGTWYLITAGVWSGYYVQESAGTTLVAPPAWPAPLATYSPAQSLYFAAGTYVGQKFDSYGTVTSSKSYTLGATSSAPTTEKRQVPNQAGSWYLITAGVWSGYYVQESASTTLGGP